MSKRFKKKHKKQAKNLKKQFGEEDIFELKDQIFLAKIEVKMAKKYSKMKKKSKLAQKIIRN